MIQIEVNGSRETIEPGSIKELRDYIHTSIPGDHVVCVLRINGNEVSETSLDDLALSSIRLVSVKSDTPQALALSALGETCEWIDRIDEVLGNVAGEYRLGNSRDGANRIVPLIDALQVLVGLLQGIHAALSLQESQDGIAAPWDEASEELCVAIQGLAEDLDAGDAVRIADRTGHAIPRTLTKFKSLLEGISA